MSDNPMGRRPTKEEAARLQYQLEHQKPRKAPSVMPYLAILAAAAFLLLVMAYFMQQRTAQSVEGLSQSVSTLQSFDQLVEENQELRGQVNSLQEALSQSQGRRQALEQQLRDLQEELSQVKEALAALQPEASPAP